MTDAGTRAPGTIGWHDLTVPKAEAVRDFYSAVVGWESGELDMGGYADFFMKPRAASEPVAGICHARGENADLPPQWLIYVAVADLDASLRRCVELGGSAVTAIKGDAGEQRYCVIRDPAGAVLALLENGSS